MRRILLILLLLVASNCFADTFTGKIKKVELDGYKIVLTLINKNTTHKVWSDEQDFVVNASHYNITGMYDIFDVSYDKTNKITNINSYYLSRQAEAIKNDNNIQPSIDWDYIERVTEKSIKDNERH